MKLTPKQIAEGWIEHDGSDVCPIKDERTMFEAKQEGSHIGPNNKSRRFIWRPIKAYRIIEAHGADAEPAVVMQGLSDDKTGLGRFGNHHDPAIDYCIQVEKLQSRLHGAKHGLSKPGEQPETILAVADDIERALRFRVGGDEGAVNAKALLRTLESEVLNVLAEPARPTPYPTSYDDLVFDDAGWSQTIIVDGKRPEWLRDDDWLMSSASLLPMPADDFGGELAIRVRRREPKRETVQCALWLSIDKPLAAQFFQQGTIDLIDGEPDLSTLKIAGGAL